MRKWKWLIKGNPQPLASLLPIISRLSIELASTVTRRYSSLLCFALLGVHKFRQNSLTENCEAREKATTKQSTQKPTNHEFWNAYLSYASNGSLGTALVDKNYWIGSRSYVSKFFVNFWFFWVLLPCRISFASRKGCLFWAAPPFLCWILNTSSYTTSY